MTRDSNVGHRTKDTRRSPKRKIPLPRTESSTTEPIYGFNVDGKHATRWVRTAALNIAVASAVAFVAQAILQLPPSDASGAIGATIVDHANANANESIDGVDDG